MKKQRDYDLI